MTGRTAEIIEYDNFEISVLQVKEKWDCVIRKYGVDAAQSSRYFETREEAIAQAKSFCDLLKIKSSVEKAIADLKGENNG